MSLTKYAELYVDSQVTTHAGQRCSIFVVVLPIALPIIGLIYHELFVAAAFALGAAFMLVFRIVRYILKRHEIVTREAEQGHEAE